MGLTSWARSGSRPARRVLFDPVYVNEDIANAIAHAGAGDGAARSRARRSRRGLELWQCVRAQHTGSGPALAQRAVEKGKYMKEQARIDERG